jgi:hypothetical protein
MPKMQGKLFAAFKIEPFVHSLVFGKGLNPADTIVPSAIGMNAHAAKSAMGSAVSVPGFITGLCWSLCALAHGQKKLAALQEGLPVASAYALEHGSSMFKHGAGISAGSLETIVLASLKAMLALPAPAKRVTDTTRQMHRQKHPRHRQMHHRRQMHRRQMHRQMHRQRHRQMHRQRQQRLLLPRLRLPKPRLRKATFVRSLPCLMMKRNSQVEGDCPRPWFPPRADQGGVTASKVEQTLLLSARSTSGQTAATLINNSGY